MILCVCVSPVRWEGEAYDDARYVRLYTLSRRVAETISICWNLTRHVIRT